MRKKETRRRKRKGERKERKGIKIIGRKGKEKNKRKKGEKEDVDRGEGCAGWCGPVGLGWVGEWLS